MDGEWIEWDGSKYEDPEDSLFSPVPHGTLVDIKLRRGEIFERLPAGEIAHGSPVDAAGAFWLHEGRNNDIIAYRVVAK